MTTLTMIAPGAQAGYSVQVPSGTTYTANASGYFTGVALSDLVGMQEAGCGLPGQRPVVTLGTGGSVIPGAVNIIPSTAGSSVSYAYTLAPGLIGQKTAILQPSGSTAATTVTSTGANVNLTNTNATVLTFTAGGTVELEQVGSTLFQVTNRTPSQSSAGAALVFQPASS